MSRLFSCIHLFIFALCMHFFGPILHIASADDFELADEFLAGSSSTIFTIDTENEAGAGDFIILRFGETNTELLQWDIDNNRFILTDDFRIEGNTAIIGQTFIANDHSVSDSDGFVNIGKNNGAFESISWNDAADNFSISDDINLNLHELQSMRIENLGAAPTCDAGSTGRLYRNTNNTNSFVCNGTNWVQIDATGSGGGAGDATIVLAQFYDSIGGVDVNTSGVTAIPLNQEIREDSGITHDTVTNNSRIQLDSPGWYQVSYNISHEVIGGNRKNIRCRARLNGSTFIIPSASYSYSRNTTDEFATNSASFLFQTSVANDYFEVVCNGEGSDINSQAANTVADESWVSIQRLSGISSGLITLDNAYDNDSGERTVEVDDGSVAWNLDAGHDFVVDIIDASSSFIVSDENSDTTPFLIDADGNVGIGISTPTQKLDVNGNTHLRGDITFDTITRTIAGIQNQNLLDKTATEDVTGIYSFINDINVGDSTSDTATFLSRIDSDFVPALDEVYNLGTPSLRWNQVYASSIEVDDGDVNVGEGGFVVSFTNGQTGGGNTITIGDVLRVKTSVANNAELTTSKNDEPIGVAVNDSAFGATVSALIIGKGVINCTGSIAIGDLIQSSNTNGHAEKGANSTKVIGTAVTACSGGQLTAIVHLE